MRVLVTGASGYLGKGICEKLSLMGCDVVAATIMQDNSISANRIVVADIFKVEDPFEFYGEPDVLLHLAWNDGFNHKSWKHLDELPQHVHFIDAIASGGCKQICVLGSMHEVGLYEGCITEATPCDPLNFYGIAKCALRESLQVLSQQYDFTLRWLRGYYIVGNQAAGNSIFSKISQAAKNGCSTFPFTSGKNKYDFLDYDDFCELVAISTIQDKVNGIIEICSGVPTSLADRVEKFITDNEFNISLEYGAYPDRPYDSDAIWGDSSKIDLIKFNL